MIPYIYYPKLNLNFEELKKIAFCNEGINYGSDINLAEYIKIIHRRVPDGLNASHQRWVKDHEYLRQLQKRIPILGDVYNIYLFKPWSTLPVHIDSLRSAALNIPIMNTDKATTSFYSTLDIGEYDPSRVINTVQKDKELFSFKMDKTIIFNTSIPHEVYNHQPEFRFSLSWGFKCNFEEAVDFFGSMSVL